MHIPHSDPLTKIKELTIEMAVEKIHFYLSHARTNAMKIAKVNLKNSTI